MARYELLGFHSGKKARKYHKRQKSVAFRIESKRLEYMAVTGQYEKTENFLPNPKKGWAD